ncbi:TRAP transporter substrate-binding protein [Acuticoccus sp. MNP-M23]|uniref:TRAP transporter substrate-binding protein n=1 Tax=Acuticoccus sp. MNP-M23 TaxID=3072793 RepID=UPI002815B768|nr:TRAP transporter substrate-binding protein [Acuticoccus sp. MNP-M23]WMS41409.1 TRAP transporter substrate-binding protein [Acuticoccus sp. MNP-M23]
MKIALNVTTALGLALAAGATFAPDANAQQVLKIAHILPAGDPRDLGARKLEELIEADDTCDLDVQVYPSGQLGMFNDINEGVQFGSIEMSVMPASYIVGTEPLFGVFDLPFFWPADADKLNELQHGPAMEKLGATMANHNMVLLDVWRTGYKQWTANRPLKALPDYDGLVARVMPSPVLAEQQKALGLTPVTMPFPETYSALQSGAIDAQENPNPTSWNMKFHEVQSHLTMTNHGTLDQVILVNKPFWDGLSDECRTAIEAAMPSANELTFSETMKQEDEAMADFAKAGLTVVELTEEERNALRDAILPTVRQFYVETNGEEGEAIVGAFEAEMED